MIIRVYMFFIFLLIATVGYAAPLYKDANATIEARVQDLISRMTLDEKIGQILLYSMDESKNIADGGLQKPFDWYKQNKVGLVLNAIDEDLIKIQTELGTNSRLGIPVLSMIDAINGHAFYPGATIFPSSLALSGTFNEKLMTQIGRVTAKEMSATGIHVTYTPGLDVARDLRWGRVGETLGEDTLLVSKLGVARIKGLQGSQLRDLNSVATSPKHMVGYSQTIGGRDATELLLSERELRTWFFPPFEAAIQEAKAPIVMAAYNSVLGIPASENAWLLNSVLRNEMGFKGFVVSDWENYDRLIDTHKTAKGPVAAAVAMLTSGNDVAMSAYDQPEALREAFKNGLLDEAVLDTSVARILSVKFALGLFDNKEKVFPSSARQQSTLLSKEHQDLAKQAATQSMVLLKNQGVLPIKAREIKHIALIGPNANDIVAQLGDWSLGFRGQGRWMQEIPQRTASHSTFLNGLVQRAKQDGVRVTYVKGSDVLDNDFLETKKIVQAIGSADLVIAVLGDNRMLTGEQLDRAIMLPTGRQNEMMEIISQANKPTVTVYLSSKPLIITEAARQSDAIIMALNPGMKGGEAFAGLLFGDENFSGRLTLTLPHHTAQTPVYYNQPPGWHGSGYYADLPKETKLPKYPFGYGLSYTEFNYSDLVLDSDKLCKGCPLTGTFKLTNSGEVGGDEVIQLYLTDKVASVTRPERLLVHFDRVFVDSGETKEIKFEIPFERLAVLDKAMKWEVEPGDFDLFISTSSAKKDIQLQIGFSY